MLYPDSKRRITEINKLSTLFQQKGYTKTATAINQFTTILEGDKIPSDFLEKLDSVFNIFQKEFENIIPVGKNFRKKVFEEIADTTLIAIKRLGADYPRALLSILPIFQSLNRGTKITSQISNFISSNNVDKTIQFHLYCYTYLVITEGIFDELARILYFLTVASPTNIPTLASLQAMSVFNIRSSLGSTFVFLNNWDDKKHIRNAIGHATATFDPLKDEAQFKDRTWDSGIIPVTDFYKMALELEDSIWAFFYDFLLLKIYDFVKSPNPFQ